MSKGWPVKTIGEITTITMGQSPPGDTYNDKRNGLPFFQGKAEFGIDYPTVVKWCSVPQRIAETGDILLSVRAPVGPTNFAKEKCCIGRGLASIRAKPEVSATPFLRYFFQFFESTISARGVGSTFSAINRKDIESTKILLPPLPDQRRIVFILDKADELRRLREQADRKTEELIPALFNEMFGDLNSNDRNWPVKQFGLLADNQDGKRRPVKAADRAERKGEYPYYGASGIIDYMDEYLFDTKALLIAEDGANLLARSTPIAFIAQGKYWVNNHAHIVTNNGKAELIYLCQFLNMRDLSDYITGSAQPKLNQANMNRIPVPIPPIELQQLFSSRVSTIRSLEADQSRSRKQLDDLFQSLLHQAFAGEL